MENEKLTTEVVEEKPKAKRGTKKASTEKESSTSEVKTTKKCKSVDKEGVEKKPTTKAKSSSAKATVKDKVDVKAEPKKKTTKAKAKTENDKLVPLASDAKKVLFVVSESAPFIRTGGLGDVAAALPKALREKGVDVRVIMPLYFDIPEAYRATMKYLGNVYVPLSWRMQYCGVFQVVYEGVTYYFVDNEQYFKRSGIYGHYDDAERFAFFSRAVLECLPIMNFYPDIIHAHDWHTALTSVFLDVFYRNRDGYKNIKTIFTIHNIEFQGKYGEEVFADILGLPESKKSLVMYSGLVNFMKGAIECSNVVTTVSPTYMKEILNPYYAYGLENILNQRKYKLKGIVNGIDTELYNPLTDKSLKQNYDFSTIELKEKNKENLLKMFGMEYTKDTPLIGMVTRLTEQKGIDLVVARLEEIMNDNVKVIILGKGDYKYENKLIELEKRYPGKLKVIINFLADVANNIYAGADMFLMPSRFEPCGLSQMIAMRYGTVPIVRRTGGLNDTVAPFNPIELTGDGFNFYSYNADDMLDAVKRAISTYHVKREWIMVVANAMMKDFSWSASSEQYLATYEEMLKA